MVRSDEVAVQMEKANFEMLAQIASFTKAALMPPRVSVYSRITTVRIGRATERLGNLPNNRSCNAPPLQAQHFIVDRDPVLS